MDLVTAIMNYESNDYTTNEMIELFSELVKTGLVFSLQGHYGRQADYLIQEGWLSETGEILKLDDETRY
jgi:hypothetical protein